MKKRIISFLLVITMFSSAALAVNTRATQAPTSYAPASWYNTPHTFTCTRYTYSSYIIDVDTEPDIYFWCQKPFYVEYCASNGRVINTVEAIWYPEEDSYFIPYPERPNTDFYVIIYNKDPSDPITTSDNGFFIVWANA